MASQTAVRVRFAPSPTGFLHVGNARTALVNWLFAKQSQGSMVLRIEDTDVERSEARFEAQLLEDLRWFGLDWSEGPDIGGQFGPYRQSERLQLYRGYSERLLAEGKAYFCFCTQKELDQERAGALAEQRSTIYSGKCRAIDPRQGAQRRASGEPCAIRLRIPERPIRFHDIVRGDLEFSSEAVSDPIVVRSSGMPVYNYVVVVDDIEMQITHVIRGDDHLSNTPRQVALYEALGSAAPKFAHLSTILGPDRERLSKRHGATSIAQFRDMGILPEALLNYLALLGWAPTGGTRETFTAKELIQEFSLKRVTASPAIFDAEKLHWLNRHYIKATAPENLAKAALPFFQRSGDLPEVLDRDLEEWFVRLVELLAPYVDRLDQLPERARIIFDYDARVALESEENSAVLASPNVRAVWREFAERLSAEPGDVTPARFKDLLNEIKTVTGAKGKDLFHPIRVMLIGKHSGPEFDKLLPLLEQGSRVTTHKRVLNVHQRVSVFMAALSEGDASNERAG